MHISLLAYKFYAATLLIVRVYLWKDMDKIKGIIFACLSASTFGMIPLFAKRAMLDSVNNDTILVYRYTIAALLYGIYLALRRMDMKVPAASLKEVVWIGVGGYGLTAFFLFLSYRYMPSGVATSIHYLYPVVVALLMSFFYKEKLSLLVKGGILLAIVGVYFMSWSAGEIKWTGLIFALMTTLTYGVYIVGLNRPRLKAMNSDVLTFYVLAFTAVFYILVALFCGTFEWVATPRFIFDMSMLGILSTIISARLLVSAVKLIGSVPSSILGTLEPITAILIGVYAFHEKLSLFNYIGLMMIIAAVLVIILKLKPKPRPQNQQEVK